MPARYVVGMQGTCLCAAALLVRGAAACSTMPGHPQAAHSLPPIALRHCSLARPQQDVDFEDEVLIEDGYRSSDEEEAAAGSPASGAAEEEVDASLADSEGEEGEGEVGVAEPRSRGGAA